MRQPTDSRVINLGTPVHVSQSAPKIAPSVIKIQRDMDPSLFNQVMNGSTTAQDNIPQGWHYTTDYNTLNVIPNLGYQGIENFHPQTGQPMPRNLGVDNMLQRVTELMHNQFGLKPKGQGFAYKCPYPKWYDRVILPARYRILDFTKFTGSNGVSTIEHISRYVTWLRECSTDQAYKVQFFALSLSRLAFTSFSSLPEGSVKNWTDLENKFHKYFFIRTGEKKITDLMATKQKNNESGLEFLQRFRETKNL